MYEKWIVFIQSLKDDFAYFFQSKIKYRKIKFACPTDKGQVMFDFDHDFNHGHPSYIPALLYGQGKHEPGSWKKFLLATIIMIASITAIVLFIFLGIPAIQTQIENKQQEALYKEPEYYVSDENLSVFAKERYETEWNTGYASADGSNIYIVILPLGDSASTQYRFSCIIGDNIIDDFSRNFAQSNNQFSQILQKEFPSGTIPKENTEDSFVKIVNGIADYAINCTENGTLLKKQFNNKKIPYSTIINESKLSMETEAIDQALNQLTSQTKISFVIHLVDASVIQTQ